MSLSLVAFDTDQIKQYVFATDVLREIRGASDILTDLNRQMPHLVDGETIYAHGGSGLFLVHTADVDRNIQRVQQAYASATDGAASITGVAIALPKDFDPATNDIRDHWIHLGAKLAAAKARNPLHYTAITHPLLRPGDSDGDYYAVDFAPGDQDTLLSRPALVKWKRNWEIRQQHEKPESFTALAEESNSNALALIYADGDGLGKVLENCPTLHAIRDTATTIHQSLGTVVDQAIRKTELTDRQYDILLHGGDDVIIVLPDIYALETALRITEAFPLITEKHLGQPHTLSTAVVWAHPSFPFGVWLDITESVLKFAKTEGARRKEQGLFNFLAISSSNHLDFKEYYAQELVSEELDSAPFRLQRTLRPYRTSVLRALCRYRDEMQHISRSKLEALRRAIFQPTYHQASLDAIRTLVHWRDAASRKALMHLVATIPQNDAPRAFPFVRSDEPLPDAEDDEDTYPCYTTALVDLIELWDVIPSTGVPDAA